jgi:hypothetical protein
MRSDKNSNLCRRRIRALEEAASNAVDPEIMASKVSSRSKDRKKYDFSAGLQRDLLKTRAALYECALQNSQGKLLVGDKNKDHHCASSTSRILGNTTTGCTFGQLFALTAGEIANLNRVLENLKQAGEISFHPECFFLGRNDDDDIVLLGAFWKQAYMVDSINVFRCSGATNSIADPKKRKGRSYVEENLATYQQQHCASCLQLVDRIDRLTIRSKVFHRQCLQCVVCGSNPRQKLYFLTFDANICCSHECVRTYDGAHILQERR